MLKKAQNYSQEKTARAVFEEQAGYCRNENITVRRGKSKQHRLSEESWPETLRLLKSLRLR